MADTTNLNQFLTDVANSIRTKKGTTGEIPAENFDVEIESIPTGTVLEKVVTEASEIIEDETVVKIDSVPVSEPVVIPENGIVEVLADKNLLAENIGLTSDKILEGNIILNVEGTGRGGTEINNQNKVITNNGIYTADEGYTGLGTVNVNVPQEDLTDTLNEQDSVIQQQTEYIGELLSILNTKTSSSDTSYSDLFTLANNIYDTGIEDDSSTVDFTIKDEQLCLYRGLKILYGGI